MRVTYNEILDFSFSIFIFASMVIPNTSLGKILQLLFIVLSIFLAYTKEKKITFFNFLELIFVGYLFYQSVSGIAVMKTSAFKMFLTMLYTSSFTIGFYNYLCHRKELKEVINVYVKATVISFIAIMLLYFKTLLSFRLDASSTIYLFDIPIFGGTSSTALSLMALIPAFFLALVNEEKNKKKRLIYIIFLSIISLVTGTRKTIVLILYILVGISLIKNKNKKLLIIKSGVKFGLIAISLFLLVMYVPVFHDTIGVRMEKAVNYFITSETDDASIRVRNRMRRDAYALFKKRPIYGWGMDYFKASSQSSLGYYSHNNFLELLSGGGIVGFCIYYSKYLYLGFLNLKLIKKYKQRRIELLLCLGFLAIMTILEYWQVTYFYRYIIIYQVILLYILNSIKGVIESEKEG